MINIPSKTKVRLTAGLKRFQPILLKSRSADINESDTVTIITDMLSDIFGYDKYTEITSEYAIKKTYCDLAILVDGKANLLIECKAIGLTLKDDFIRQALSYAADAGIDWVVLTNGIDWKIFKVLFSKPIEKELVYTFDITGLNPKKESDLEMLFYLSHEATSGKSKNTLEELHIQKQLVNRFVVGQILCTEPVLDAVRRQLKKLSNEIKTSNEEIKTIICDEIIKREVAEGDLAADAKKKILKMEKSQKPVKTKDEAEMKE